MDRFGDGLDIKKETKIPEFYLTTRDSSAILKETGNSRSKVIFWTYHIIFKMLSFTSQVQMSDNWNIV